MRLDKFFSAAAVLSRKECARAVRAGRVTVGGAVAKKPDQPCDPEKDEICLDGVRIGYRKNHYILLYKPDGVVSATEDGKDETVLSLLPPEYTAWGLFPCGRLDKHTTGLMLLTDDGELAHRLLSPRRHVEKSYRYRVKFPLTAEECTRFEAGLVLEDGYETKPAKIRQDDAYSGTITLMEGKYHQIKRMMLALHNQITELKRVTFGPLTLPAEFSPGEWREVNETELATLRAAAGLPLTKKEP